MPLTDITLKHRKIAIKGLLKIIFLPLKCYSYKLLKTIQTDKYVKFCKHVEKYFYLRAFNASQYVQLVCRYARKQASMIKRKRYKDCQKIIKSTLNSRFERRAICRE